MRKKIFFFPLFLMFFLLTPIANLLAQETWEDICPGWIEASGGISDLKIAVDKVNDIVYIAYINRMSNDLDVQKFENGDYDLTWGEEVTTYPDSEMGFYFDLRVNPRTNELYIAYNDPENGYKATVKKFNGLNWELVGTAGFSEGSIGDPMLAFNVELYEERADHMVLAYVDHAYSNFISVQAFTDEEGWTYNYGGERGMCLADNCELAFEPYIVYKNCGTYRSTDGVMYYTPLLVYGYKTTDNRRGINIVQSEMGMAKLKEVELTNNESEFITGISFDEYSLGKFNINYALSSGKVETLKYIWYENGSSVNDISKILSLNTNSFGDNITSNVNYSASANRPLVAFRSDGGFHPNKVNVIYFDQNGEWGYVGDPEVDEANENIYYPVTALNGEGDIYLAYVNQRTGYDPQIYIKKFIFPKSSSNNQYEASCTQEGKLRIVTDKDRVKQEDVYLYTEDGDFVERDVTNYSGEFTFENLERGEDYYLVARKKKNISYDYYQKRRIVYIKKYAATFGEEWVKKFDGRYRLKIDDDGDFRFYKKYKGVEKFTGCEADGVTMWLE